MDAVNRNLEMARIAVIQQSRHDLAPIVDCACERFGLFASIFFGRTKSF